MIRNGLKRTICASSGLVPEVLNSKNERISYVQKQRCIEFIIYLVLVRTVQWSG